MEILLSLSVHHCIVVYLPNGYCCFTGPLSIIFDFNWFYLPEPVSSAPAFYGLNPEFYGQLKIAPVI